MASPANKATSLKASLSKDAQILIDPEASSFKEALKRWTDVGVQIPAAIIKPTSEDDVVKIVEIAIQNKIPFVVRGGGNSPWSTIGPEGWIIDLTLLTEITLSPFEQIATIQPGVLSKSINEAVSKIGFCIQSPGSSKVAVIPFILGGGSSYLNGLYGMAVDSLISARVVTATKGLVTASESENPELFWALKGAGHFFGLVTSVTMKMYPLKETVISWNLFFPAEKIREVAEALEVVSTGEQVIKSPGLAAIMAPPGSDKPLIMVGIMHFVPEDEAEKVMAPLLALSPLQQIKKPVPWSDMTDSAEALATHGGMKSLISCGMKHFDGRKFEKSLELWEKLGREVPDAKGCYFMFMWFSLDGMKKVPVESSAWSHRDIGVWSMLFVNGKDKASHKAGVESAKEFLEMCQEDYSESEKALFPNHWRGTDDIVRRFRGDGTVKKLRELKAVWDPEGVFTKQFL